MRDQPPLSWTQVNTYWNNNSEDKDNNGEWRGFFGETKCLNEKKKLNKTKQKQKQN